MKNTTANLCRAILLLMVLVSTANAARAEVFTFYVRLAERSLEYTIEVNVSSNIVVTTHMFNSKNVLHKVVFKNCEYYKGLALGFADAPPSNTALYTSHNAEYLLICAPDQVMTTNSSVKLIQNENYYGELYRADYVPKDMNAYSATYARLKEVIRRRRYGSGSSGGSSAGSWQSQAQVVVCLKCNGSGKCNSLDLPEIYCQGTGFCQHCHGTGRGILDTICFACHGSGKCSYCGGTGVCRQCLGTGYLRNGISAPRPQSQASTTTRSSSSSRSSGNTYRPSTSSSSSSVSTTARRSSSSSTSATARRSTSTATRAASRLDLPYSVAVTDATGCAAMGETVKEKDGSTFTGVTSNFGMKRAGILRKPNGDVFTGYLALRRIPSEGKMEYHNGDVFVGKFKNGKRSHGTLRLASGKMFTGDFDEKGNASKGTWR